MKKNYNLINLFVLFAVVMIAAGVNAQAIGEVQWEDHFDDAENDWLLNNAGWIYFGEDDDLVGQQVMQTEDQKAFLKAGVFSSVIGAALIQSNGVDFIDPTDMDATEARIVAQSEFNDPNQVVTFNVNFKKISMVDGGQYPFGSFFLCGARLQAGEGDEYPDPTVDSTYALFIAPLANMTAIVKFSGELTVLNPAAWTYLTPQSTDFEYDLGVPYSVKFYLNEADLKVKVWEGDPSDEPDEWLLETTDPDPWIAGTFLEFGLLGDPVTSGSEPDGDEMIIDDVVVSFFEGANSVESDGKSAPAEFALADNYPNPFNPQTTIEYTLENAGAVAVNVYSVTGRLVQTLVNDYQAAGTHSVVFNGADANGNALPSGIYFYTLKNDAQTITKKMILTK
jgi:hypothetical protein